MYISNCSTPLSSPVQHAHHLTSMSSLTCSLSVVVNHGPPRSQQVLFAAHPCESHRGSSRYHWDSYGPLFPDSQKKLSYKTFQTRKNTSLPQMKVQLDQGRGRHRGSWRSCSPLTVQPQRSRCGSLEYRESQTVLQHKMSR